VAQPRLSWHHNTCLLRPRYSPPRGGCCCCSNGRRRPINGVHQGVKATTRRRAACKVGVVLDPGHAQPELSWPRPRVEGALERILTLPAAPGCAAAALASQFDWRDCRSPCALVCSFVWPPVCSSTQHVSEFHIVWRESCDGVAMSVGSGDGGGTHGGVDAAVGGAPACVASFWDAATFCLVKDV